MIPEGTRHLQSQSETPGHRVNDLSSYEKTGMLVTKKGSDVGRNERARGFVQDLIKNKQK